MSYHNDHDEDGDGKVKGMPVSLKKEEEGDDTTSESESDSESGSEVDSASDDESGFLSDSIPDTESPSVSEDDSDPGDPESDQYQRGPGAISASGPSAKLADRLAAFIPQLAAANASLVDLAAEDIGTDGTAGGKGFEIEEEDDGDDTIEEDSDSNPGSEGDTLSDNDDQEEEEEGLSHPPSPALAPSRGSGASQDPKSSKPGRTKTKTQRKRKQPYIEMSLDLGILEATTGGDGQLVENAGMGTREETALVRDGVKIPLKRTSSVGEEGEAEIVGNGGQAVSGAVEERGVGDGGGEGEERGILDALLHPEHAAGAGRKRRKVARVGIVEVV